MNIWLWYNFWELSDPKSQYVVLGQFQTQRVVSVGCVEIYGEDREPTK